MKWLVITAGHFLQTLKQMKKALLFLLLVQFALLPAFSQKLNKEAYFKVFHQNLSKNLVKYRDHPLNVDTFCVSKMIGVKFRLNTDSSLDTVMISLGTPSMLSQFIQTVLEETMIDMTSTKTVLAIRKSEEFILPLLFSMQIEDCGREITPFGLKDNFSSFLQFGDAKNSQLIEGTLLKTVVFEVSRIK